MASISIPDQNRELNDTQEICDFLSQYGIWYENWEVEGRIDQDADSEEILAAYGPEIERLKERGNFVTADVIAVNPDTPNLDAMLQKFADEHTHSEDEVRFTVKGSGIFHIHPEGGPVFAVLVESGDLINVPAGTKHWFNLCDTRTIRCIRLFEDASGWTPNYVDAPVNEQYETVCFGPNYLPSNTHVDSVIKP
jgi:1,2-dihydroxy-3-keto-5-methylthiopentene dioxygenase